MSECSVCGRGIDEEDFCWDCEFNDEDLTYLLDDDDDNLDYDIDD